LNWRSVRVRLAAWNAFVLMATFAIAGTSRLIDDLLLLARTDAEGEEFAFEPMDLAESLREACEQGRVLADAARLCFALDVKSACPVLGDPQAPLPSREGSVAGSRRRRAWPVDC
jgi:hypothetical protein